ncbi:Ig domain-containing protein [Mesorhizobium sp. SP-1A]|uniref:Ig domain-containing protein n=1 Tax=Mesorhizobium sp. SP-1A TaxID=3077840 RepID=UPI0028F6E51E|nr:Ig domain-containing protein [Mesorhizobium sp. SP-1A]
MKIRLLLALTAALAASATPSMAETKFLYRHTNSSGSFVQNQENAFSVEVVNKDPMYASELWETKLLTKNTDEPVTFSVQVPPEVQYLIQEDKLLMATTETGHLGPFIVTATSGEKTATTSFYLDAYSILVVEKPSDLRTLEGKEIEGEINATGGKAPYAFAFADDANIPETLKLDTATGKLSGTAQAGNYQVQITVTDASNKTAQTALNLTIDKAEHWQSTVALSSLTGVKAIPLISQNTVLMTTNFNGGEPSATIMDSSGHIYSQKTLSAALPILARASSNSLYMAGGEHIVKIDDLGNVQWKKNVKAGTKNILFHSIATSSDGGLIGIGSISSAYYLTKLSASGNPFWVKKLPFNSTSAQISFGGDGKIYVIFVGSPASALIFDGDGNLENSFTFNQPLQSVTLAANPSGGVIISTSSKVFSLSANGSIAWSRVFNSIANDVQKGISGEIYITFHNTDTTYGYGILNTNGTVSNAGILTNPDMLNIAAFKDVYGEDVVIGMNASKNSVVLKYDPSTLDDESIKWNPISYTGSVDTSLSTTAASYSVSSVIGPSAPTSTISITESTAPSVSVEAIR